MTTILLVDYGGVFADHHQEPAESELAGSLGLDPATLRPLLSEDSEHGRAFREGRVTESAFWSEVARLANRNRATCPDDATLSRLWAETYRPNTEVVGLMEAVRKNSLTGILTNIDEGRSRYLTSVLSIEKLVDIYLPSFRFRATKPSSAIFEKTTEYIRAQVGECRIFYADDRHQHIEAAGRYGWQGLEFTAVPEFRAALVAHGILR